MNFLLKIAAHIAINAGTLYLIGTYIEGFPISLAPKYIFIGALALTAINFIIKPVVKLVLSPLILLTLGVALIAINGLMLYILTIFVPAVIVDPIQPLALVYAALLTTGINIITGLLF